MDEKRTKTISYKVLVLVLTLCVFTTGMFGCKDKNKDGETTTDASETSSEVSDTSSSDTSSSVADGSSSNDTTSKTAGGSSKTTKSGTKKTTAAKTAAATDPPAQKSNTYYAPKVYTNSAPGTAVLSQDGGVVDYSNCSSGYVMVGYNGASSNCILQMRLPNGVTDQYFFSGNAGYIAVPLTGGSGTYSFTVGAESGGSYYPVLQDSISVGLSSQFAPYLRPNNYVNYNSSTSCVQYAANLTRGCDTDLAKVDAIYNYVINNFSYDNAKASSVTGTYIPSLNTVWSQKRGICSDYSATMAAMLRTQGIPTKVVIGYAYNGSGRVYHAWINTYINGSGWINGIIYFDGSSWKLMDPTFASTGKQSQAAYNIINNSSNYSAEHYY